MIRIAKRASYFCLCLAWKWRSFPRSVSRRKSSALPLLTPKPRSRRLWRTYKEERRGGVKKGGDLVRMNRDEMTDARSQERSRRNHGFALMWSDPVFEEFLEKLESGLSTPWPDRFLLLSDAEIGERRISAKKIQSVNSMASWLWAGMYVCMYVCMYYVCTMYVCMYYVCTYYVCTMYVCTYYVCMHRLNHAWYAWYSTSAIFIVFENIKLLQEYYKTIRLWKINLHNKNYSIHSKKKGKITNL